MKILLILPLIFQISVKAENIETKSKVSYYGEYHHGKKTASGEIFNMHKMTCASPVLPFNTKVKITNLNNNKSVVVRVNDRGPFAMDNNGKALRPLRPHSKRAFDLSKAAFEQISKKEKGVINIKYVIL